MFPYNLNLDIKEKNYNQIKCIRYDNIEVNFYIFDNSQKVNLDEFDVQIKTQFENGNFIIQTDNIAKIDNRINCKLDPKFTDNNGEFELQITLLKNNEIKSLFAIDLIVLEGSIKEEKVSEENVVTIIKELDYKIVEAINTRNSLVESIESGNINDISAKANDWENFKENGGEINGNLKLNAGALTARGIASIDSELGLTSKDKKIWFGELAASGGEIAFRPQKADIGTINLGWKGFEFKDLWLEGHSKTANGYSKLPNGLIMQWGNITLSGSGHQGVAKTDSVINFPIQFPGGLFVINSTANANENDYAKVVQHGIIRTGTSNSSFKPYATIQSTTAWRIEINWIAIGY